MGSGTQALESWSFSRPTVGSMTEPQMAPSLLTGQLITTVPLCSAWLWTLKVNDNLTRKKAGVYFSTMKFQISPYIHWQHLNNCSNGDYSLLKIIFMHTTMDIWQCQRNQRPLQNVLSSFSFKFSWNFLHQILSDPSKIFRGISGQKLAILPCATPFISRSIKMGVGTKTWSGAA